MTVKILYMQFKYTQAVVYAKSTADLHHVYAYLQAHSVPSIAKHKAMRKRGTISSKMIFVSVK